MALASSEHRYIEASLHGISGIPALAEAMNRGLLANAFDDMQIAGMHANLALQGAEKLNVSEAIEAGVQAVGDAMRDRTQQI